MARELATLLNVPSLDLDDLIEVQEGMSIPEIFDAMGEGYFREAESRCLRQSIAGGNDFVMATGGGAPCFYDGIRVMLESGTVIFMDVPISELANRIQEQGSGSRPLFTPLNPADIEKTLEQILFDRISFYSKAHVTAGPATRAVDLNNWLSALRTKKPQ